MLCGLVFFFSVLLVNCSGFLIPRCTFELFNSRSIALAAGFGKPKEAVEKSSRLPAPDTSCACGSGKLYLNCCKPYHENGSPNANPVEVVRARFSALVYGVVPYLLRTTHPDNKLFVPDDDSLKIGSKKTKRSVWEKEVQAFSDAFEFRGLQFEDEARDSAPAAEQADATVSIRLERKLQSAFKYDEIEEQTRFRRSPTGEGWCVAAANLRVRSASEKMVKSTQENQFKK